MDTGAIYATNNYGDIKVIKYLNSKQVEVEFLNTGFITITTALDIRNGSNTRDLLAPKVNAIGYTGVGEYSFSNHKKAYKCWEGILYNKIVVTEWYNFQTFSDWYYSNQEEGKQLTVIGTTAKPSTCKFLTKSEQITLNNPVQVFEFKDGTKISTTNKAEFCREYGLDPSAVTRLSKGKQKTHKGWQYIGGVVSTSNP